MPNRSLPFSGDGSARSGVDMRTAVSLLVLGCATTLLVDSARAQVSNQSFEITPATPRPTVGDTVVLNLRVRLDERDLLLERAMK